MSATSDGQMMGPAARWWDAGPRRLAWWLLAASLGIVGALWIDAGLWRLVAALVAFGVLAVPRLPRVAPSALVVMRTRLLLLLAIACAAQATAPQLWRFATSPWVRVWNVYHYYLGSKYFTELGYGDLYVATLAADEAGDDYWRSIGTIRDLATYELIPRRAALASYRPEDHFSETRWRDFRRDVEALQKQRPADRWRDIFRDRGYNPSPLWTALGRLLTFQPASWLWALKLLCALDLLLLVATFRLIGRSFGPRTLATTLLLLTLSPVNDGRIVGGLLQYDWLCALAAGLCWLRRRRPWPAAACLAYAVGSRIFPVILLLSLSVVWLRSLVLDGRLVRRDRRLVVALVVCGAVAFGLSVVAGGGLGGWQGFVANIAHHNEAHRFGQQRLGWAHAFTRDVRDLDFTKPETEQRRALFAQQKNLFLISGALLLVLWGVAVARRKAGDAFLLGLAPFFVLTVSSRYYWACLALLPLLARPGPSGHRRVRWLTAVQLVLLALLATAELRGLEGFSLYSFFDLLLAIFFVVMLGTFVLWDLRVWRRRHPPVTWYRSRGLILIFFVALFLLLCWLRMPDARRPIYDVDEAVSSLIASSWLDGGVPYRDAIDQRGPVTYLIYAVVFALVGSPDMAAVHWALLLLILGSCGVVFALGRRLRRGASGVAVGYLAAFLMAVCTFTYSRSQLLAFHTEWPMMLLDASAMLLLWRALGRPEGDGRAHRGLVLAGVCFALGFLSKQPGIFDAGAGAAFVLLWRQRQGTLMEGGTVRVAALLAVGFFSTLAFTAGYFAWRGALGDFVFYYWTYNVEHYTAVVPMWQRWAALDPLVHRRHYLTTNPLLLVGGLATVGAAVVAWLARRRVDGRLLIGLWLVAGYFGASYSGRNFGHYFIQIIAPACLATALAGVDLWRLLSPRRHYFRDLGDVALAGRGLVVALAMIALVAPVVRHGSEIAWLNLWRERPVDGRQERLLEAIRQHAPADETIFVWGYYPELYVLAPRRPASRYSNTNYLTGLLPWENTQPGVDTSEHIVKGAWDLLIKELETSRPMLVVDTSVGDHRFYAKYPIDHYPPLVRFLAQGYHQATVVADRRGRPIATLWQRDDRRRAMGSAG